jgi:hypothetical protein
MTQNNLRTLDDFQKNVFLAIADRTTYRLCMHGVYDEKRGPEHLWHLEGSFFQVEKTADGIERYTTLATLRERKSTRSYEDHRGTQHPFPQTELVNDDGVKPTLKLFAKTHMQITRYPEYVEINVDAPRKHLS